jgi:hypothetical protein
MSASPIHVHAAAARLAKRWCDGSEGDGCSGAGFDDIVIRRW